MKNNSLQARQKRLKKMLHKRANAEFKRIKNEIKQHLKKILCKCTDAEFKRIIDEQYAMMIKYHLHPEIMNEITQLICEICLHKA